MEYEIVFSARRTISLCIKDERLIVRAPYGTNRERIETVISSHSGWIDNNIKKQHDRRINHGELTDERIAELRKLAKRVLSIKTEYYARIMGLKYGRITITGAKTRFGSCSGKGNIAFSYRLMMYPDEAIDYVVVHELAHLKEMNHSKNFYAIVSSVLPDYKRRAKLLKK